MKSLSILGLAFLVGLFLVSCDNDEAFDAGWDESIVNADLALNPETSDDILLATINPDNIASDYVAVNHPGAKWFEIKRAIVTSGAVVSTDLIELDDIIGFDIYALYDGEETLIADMADHPAQVGVLNLQAYNVDISDISANGDIQIVARPEFFAQAGITDINVEVELIGIFNIVGAK